MPRGTLGGYKGDYWTYNDTVDFHPEKQLSKNIEDEFKLFDKPKITNKNEKIVIFGSCFSQHLLNSLKSIGFKNVDNCLIPSGLNNIFAIKQLLSYIIKGDDSYNSYSYNKKYEKNTWIGDINKIKKELNKTDLIILTIGLAEYWIDNETGGKFWMGVPNHVYDEKKHELKVATPEEIYNEMNEITKLIKSKIMFVICPVPLRATFTKERCMVANCISKSICRCGVNMFFSKNENPNVIYFPVYELLYFLGTYYKQDKFESNVPRHISNEFLSVIGKFFNYLFT